jgi:ketosteroid isomerase-like protein
MRAACDRLWQEGDRLMATNQDLVTRAYAAFNARDIEAALILMQPDVDWPNGMEGGRVQGHEGIRDYWTRQWTLIDPHVEPRGFSTDGEGRTVVDVHQLVRDMDGNVIVDEMVQHVYIIEDGLVRSMEIRKE